MGFEQPREASKSECCPRYSRRYYKYVYIYVYNKLIQDNKLKKFTLYLEPINTEIVD